MGHFFIMTLVNNVIMALRKIRDELSPASEANSDGFYKRVTSIEFINEFFEELKTFILLSLGNSETESTSACEKPPPFCVTLHCQSVI